MNSYILNNKSGKSSIKNEIYKNYSSNFMNQL
jgi:hypothetical protein